MNLQFLHKSYKSAIPTAYKFFKSVVPMILLTLSVGWCYAWSLFAKPIALHMNVSEIAVQFTFCLNILLLGLGAAFFGNFVERKIKASSVLSTVLLCLGFICTYVGLHFHCIYMIYLGAGILCGLAQGIAYVISPKNLLLWWNKTKYKATVMSLSIICFGLGSSLCSVLFNKLNSSYGIETTVISLSAIYTVMMSIGALMINKPKFAIRKIKNSVKFSYKKIFSNRSFWQLWTFMFLNISAGLILIGNCASILKTAEISNSMIITVMFICGLSNGFGRLLFPIISDFMKKKTFICMLILGIEICVVSPTIFVSTAIPLMIILVNATYGSAFAVLPSLVLHLFGNSNLTTIHGLVLSAWGIASVFAYLCSTTLNILCIGSTGMLVCILAMYAANFANVMLLKK